MEHEKRRSTPKRNHFRHHRPHHQHSQAQNYNPHFRNFHHQSARFNNYNNNNMNSLLGNYHSQPQNLLPNSIHHNSRPLQENPWSFWGQGGRIQAPVNGSAVNNWLLLRFFDNTSFQRNSLVPIHRNSRQQSRQYTSFQGNMSDTINQEQQVANQENGPQPPSSEAGGKQQQQRQSEITSVMMTKLPFIEVIATPLEVALVPTGAGWSCSHVFVIQEPMLGHFMGKTDPVNPYQVLVRFCKHDPKNVQDDYFPSNLTMMVNGQMCQLPGWNVIPKRPAAPVEITNKCDFHKNSNTLHVMSCAPLVMFIHVVRRLTHEDLLQKLLARSPIDPSATVAKIKEKLKEDNVNGADITLTSLHFSLLCPLSKARMKLPCRASSCEHLQCFDATCYLQMNEKNAKWVCPVCSDPVDYENLEIDKYFKNILEENTSSMKILLQADGSWKPFLPQDLNGSILTLDDTLDPLNATVGAASDVTSDGATGSHLITVSLLSEDETSVDEEEDGIFELTVTDLASSTDNQNHTAAEVVVLSGDDLLVSPVHRVLRKRPSQRSLLGQQQATSTPNASTTKKRKKNMTPKATTTTTHVKKTTRAARKTSTLNKSIGNIVYDFIPLDTSDLHLT